MDRIAAVDGFGGGSLASSRQGSRPRCRLRRQSATEAWYPLTPLHGRTAARPVARRGGEATTPATLSSSWSADPLAILPLLLMAALYARGVWAIGHRRGAGGVHCLRVLAVAWGLGVVGLAIVSPLNRLGAALLSAHMAQYLLLSVLAPLLIAGGRPGPALAAGLPAAWRGWWEARSALRAGAGGAWRRLGRPLPVGLLDLGLLLGWHLPAVHTAALSHAPLLRLEQWSVLGAGVLYWQSLRDAETRPDLGRWRVMGCVIATSVLASVFGFVMYASAAPEYVNTATPWYAIYNGRTTAWGLSPLEDQQLGGLIVGLLPDSFDVIPVLVLLYRWLSAEEPDALAPSAPEPAEGAGAMPWREAGR